MDTLFGNNVLCTRSKVDVMETKKAIGTNNAAEFRWSTKGALATTTPASYFSGRS